jgi:hypothetical protein
MLNATVLDGLAAPALRDDAPAWVQAWQDLDAGPLAELLRALLVCLKLLLLFTIKSCPLASKCESLLKA